MPKDARFKKVCRSHARIRARDSALARAFQTKRERRSTSTTSARTLWDPVFFAERFTHVGQWGTHVDPPAHFVKGLRTVDQIDPKEMIVTLVLIDAHREAAAAPDYILSLERARKREKDHGQIPSGALVAMRTDWSKRWPHAAKMENKDAKGVVHYPGWNSTALKYLYEDQKITASSHETTDPGIATSKDDYSLETYILRPNHYQIGLLPNLDQVPEAGAIVVVSFPKPKNGSGFPARVFAIVP